MSRSLPRAVAALSLAFLAACASAPTAQERAAATEQSVLAPLKAKYPDIVTSFDISGKRLDLSIDANGYIRTGDDAIAAFKGEAGAAWRKAWMKAHPGKHATLTLRFVDYVNRTWFHETLKA